MGENAAVWDFLAVDNFDFTRKMSKKNLGEKLVKQLGICTFYLLTTLISRENCKVLSKLNFLDKSLTFRIMCRTEWNKRKKVLND